MRKILLILGAVMITISGFAQSQAQLNLPRRQRSMLNDPATVPASNVPLKDNTSPVFNKASGVHSNTRYAAQFGAKIGSSANIFTALVPEQHCFGYKKVGSHDVYYFIHRQCNSFINLKDPSSNGAIEMDASIDHGNTFDSSMHRVFVQTYNGKRRPRYPSGDLFVPNGDTNWRHSLAVGSGPVTDSASWRANWFGSCSIDTANKHYTLINTSSPDFVFPRLSTTATANFVWALSIKENPNPSSNAKTSGLGLYKGTYHATGDSFSWAVTNLPLHSRSYRQFNTTTLTYDTGYYLLSANMAWGKDGKTGYVVACSIDSTDANNNHFKYHIWKTTDEGNTWTTSVLDPSDTIYTHLKDSIPAIKGSTTTKYFFPFNDEDLVVDASGYLHIVTGFTGAYSPSADSMLYSYLTDGKGKKVLPYLIDFFQNNTGKWSYYQIGKLLTSEVTATTAKNYYSDGSSSFMSWGSRIQASCEYSTNKVFYTWLDSDPTVNAANLVPDVYVSGLDIPHSKFMPVSNMTNAGNNSGSFYWLFAAKTVLKTKSGSKNLYSIPASSSLPFKHPLNGGAPHNHFFITGLDIPEDSFYMQATIFDNTATSEIKNVGNIVRVYPNPANTNVTIEFTAQHGANVTVELTNLLGQTLHTQNVVSIVGVNRINLDMTNLTQGLYLIVIKNGESLNTYKLIKE